jgi:hypothetical protein
MMGSKPDAGRDGDVNLRQRASTQSRKVPVTVPAHYRRERTRAKF